MVRPAQFVHVQAEPSEGWRELDSADRVTGTPPIGPGHREPDWSLPEPGIEGLVPLSESGVSRDADVKKAFRVAEQLQVVVLGCRRRSAPHTSQRDSGSENKSS